MDAPSAAARLVAALREQGVVRDPRVAAALLRVPRERFLAEEMREQAYVDAAQPLAEGQTLSAPHMVAVMAEALALAPGQRVLEVGGGSGYHAAVMAELVAPGGVVLSVERLPSLAEGARRVLAELRPAAHVEVLAADGSGGLPERAPFDRISVAAGAPNVPAPLVEQLASPGRLVVPVGPPDVQDLLLVDKDARGHVVRRSLGPVRFVPLVGAHGWAEPS